MYPLPSNWRSPSEEILQALKSEQVKRVQAEQKATLFQSFFIRIAPTLVGLEQWQSAVAKKPPHEWTVDEWRTFLWSARAADYWKEQSEFWENKAKATERDLAIARADLVLHKRQLAEANRKAERLSWELDELESMLYWCQVHAATRRSLVITGAAEPTPDPWAVDWPVIDPEPPAEFADRLGKGDRWRRQALFLYLLGTKGWSLQYEILTVLGELEGFRPTSGTGDRLVRESLASKGFVKRELLYLGVGPDGRRRRLAVVRLTEEGRALCRALGWEPVESDWERLIRLHQGQRQKRHAAAVLAFAFHARRRGWQAYVMPEVKSKVFRPDVLVERDGERYYVEVERRLGLRQKWRHQMRYQGCVVFCTTHEMKRQQMVAECERLGFYGWATDLETLERHLRSYGWGPLWVEEIGDVPLRYHNVLGTPYP